jgi:hypothetical protein
LSQEVLDALCTQIEDAFKEVPYPGDSHIVGHECTECWETQQRFRRKHWNELSVDKLFGHSGALALLTPEAFQFYLPAYLIACANDPRGADFILNEVLCMFASPEHSRLIEYHNARIESLTESQKDAARAFVIYIQNRFEEGYLYDAADFASFLDGLN